MSAAARVLEPARPPITFEALLELLPDLTTSAGPPATLDPPLTHAEIAYLMGEATPEEKREAMDQFGKRASASADREFWTCGVPDEDEDP